MTRKRSVGRMGQREFVFPQWGGRREGAGRKKDRERRLLPYGARERFGWRTPVHVTLKLVDGLPSMRGNGVFGDLRGCIAAARERFDVRIVHFAVLGNHVHLIVEAVDALALGRAMKGLKVRMARCLNRGWRRVGRVWQDRYHAEVLRSPRQVLHAIRYVLHDARKHGVPLAGPVDPCSSGPWFPEVVERFGTPAEPAPVVEPRSPLLRSLWQRAERAPARARRPGA
ncbi:MAG: transposase [Planctomycetes bacterium]|nr:transposase [Planctomycetota bacterium]